MKRGKQPDRSSDRRRVEVYLASLPPKSRAALRKVRAAVRAVAPGAVEAISYGLPFFKLEGQSLVCCAGWKNHISLYPFGTAFLRAHAPDARGYETSKGTIRFPLDRPPPVGLVKRLVKARIAVLRKQRSA